MNAAEFRMGRDTDDELNVSGELHLYLKKRSLEAYTLRHKRGT